MTTKWLHAGGKFFPGELVASGADYHTLVVFGTRFDLPEDHVFDSREQAVAATRAPLEAELSRLEAVLQWLDEQRQKADEQVTALRLRLKDLI